MADTFISERSATTEMEARDESVERSRAHEQVK